MMNEKAANAAFVEIAKKGLEKFKCDPDGFYWYLKGALDAKECCCDTRGEEDPKDKEVLFIETISGQRFKSTKETILEAERDLKMYYIASNAEASVNDWLDILGLHHSEIGDRMIWTVERLPIIHFTDGVDKDGNKVMCINYVHLPSPRIVEFDFY